MSFLDQYQTTAMLRIKPLDPMFSGVHEPPGSMTVPLLLALARQYLVSLRKVSLLSLNVDYLCLWIQDWMQALPWLRWVSDSAPHCMACPWIAVGCRNKASWPHYAPAGVSEDPTNPTKCILTACGSTPSTQLSEPTGGPFPQRPTGLKMKTSASISTRGRAGGTKRTTMTDVPPPGSYLLIVESLIRSSFLPLGPHYRIRCLTQCLARPSTKKATSQICRLLKQKPVRNWFYVSEHACNAADAPHTKVSRDPL